ncbi:MAG: glutamate racemase [Erythrobacter tepidarius]
MPNLNNRSENAAPVVLIFDSGVGGLTVFREVAAARPDARYVYLADDAGFPYGNQPHDELIVRIVAVIGDAIATHKPDLIVIACNTASTIALGMVREVLEVPVVGTVPAIKPAAALTRTGTIGLVGTEATIRQRYVDDLESRFAADKRLLRIAAPALVGAAEAKLRGEAVDPAVIADVHDRLAAMPGGAAIDTLVLACTHFPLLSEELAGAFGPQVAQVDGAQGIARRIAHLLEGQSLAIAGAPNRFVVTGPLSGAAGLEAALAARGFGSAEAF